MKCKECPNFKIAYEPMMPWDTGLAVCEKHNLECDFSSQRKLNMLTCIEEEKMSDHIGDGNEMVK